MTSDNIDGQLPTFSEPAPAAELEKQPFPWPPQPGEPILAAVSRLWTDTLFRPAQLFRTLPTTGKWTGPAILYYLIVGMLAFGADMFWQMILGPRESFLGMEAMDPGNAFEPLFRFLLSPLMLLAGLGLAAAVTHAGLAILGGARHGFGTTVRVFCYAYAPQILTVIPYVGVVAGSIWMVVIAIIGLREAHQTTSARAALAVLVPLGLVSMLFALAALVGMSGDLLTRPVR